MKVINGRRFLDDADKIIVRKKLVVSKWGLNEYLAEPFSSFESFQKMTYGDFKERKARGDFQEEDNIGVYSYDIFIDRS